MTSSYLRTFCRRVMVSSLTVMAACSSQATQTGESGSGGTPSIHSGATEGGADGTGNGGNAQGGSGAGGDVGHGGASTGSGGSSSRGGAVGTGGRRGTGGLSASGGSAAGGAVGGAGGLGSSPPSGGSIQLKGNKILDSKGNVIVARGPEDVVASAGQTKEIDQIAALGANAMRMLFTLDASNGMTPAAFDNLLASAASHHMLVWVSLYTWDSGHNHTIASALGGGDFYSLPTPDGATTCSSATPSSCYLAVWSRQWLKDLMNKYRANVIVDAGQEFINPGDASSETARATWATAAKTNIKLLRSQGYTNPLEIMANYSGRDLYCIVEYGESIRATDTVTVDGEPQTMFGWQAYWGTSDKYYPNFQGPLLTGQSKTAISGPDAIHQYAATQKFPIQIGIDNYPADTNQDYQAEIDQAATDNMSWLWWSWKSSNVECPASGSTCQSYVTTSQNGFKGAKPLSN